MTGGSTFYRNHHDYAYKTTLQFLHTIVPPESVTPDYNSNTNSIRISGDSATTVVAILLLMGCNKMDRITAGEFNARLYTDLNTTVALVYDDYVVVSIFSLTNLLAG